MFAYTVIRCLQNTVLFTVGLAVVLSYLVLLIIQWMFALLTILAVTLTLKIRGRND